MDIKNLLNPIEDNRDTYTYLNTNVNNICESTNSDTFNRFNNSNVVNNRLSKVNKNLKYYKIIKRFKKVGKELKFCNDINENEYVRRVYEILNIIPFSKFKSCTANKLVIIISYIIIKEDNLNIKLEEIIDINKEMIEPCENEIYAPHIKKLIESIGKIYKPNEYNKTIEENLVAICEKLELPSSIIQKCMSLLYLTKDESFMSKSIRCILGAIILMTVNNYKKSFSDDIIINNIGITKIAIASESSDVSIRNMYKILDKLLNKTG